MTEEEAKAKWCPFARQMVQIDSKGTTNGPIAIGSANRFAAAEGSLCFGAGCMAWRTVQRNHHPKPVDDTHTVTIGFCGLAGEPK